MLIDNNNGRGKRKIQNKIQKARNIVGALNSVRWDKNITMQNNAKHGLLKKT